MSLNCGCRITGIMFGLVLMFQAGSGTVSGAEDKPPVDISAQWFLSYQAQEKGGKNSNQFLVNRGYLNFKQKLSSTLSARITPDVTTEKEGDGEGDLKVRLKYIYLKTSVPGNSLLTDSYFEFGVVHRPWLDFEQHVNLYRSQGKMYLERNGQLNSADMGITYFSLLGGEIDEEYQKTVSSSYPGRYGSVAFGVYNGGGYHDLEKNENKTLEGRLTLRPAPDTLPGLQLSYFGVYGKGNIAAEPDWTLHTLYLSMEHARYVLAGTYYTGTGNSKGKAVDAFGKSVDMTGYSLFGDLSIPDTKFNIFGRYDWYDNNDNADNDTVERIILGVAYNFQGKHKLLIDYDTAQEDGPGSQRDSSLKATIEVKF